MMADFPMLGFSSLTVCLLISISFSILCYYLRRFWIKAPGLKVLPGPPPNFLGQNAGQFDPLSPFSTFHKWAREYGPIFQLKVGFQHIISVNDPRIAKEMFEKRGAKYSGRLSPHVGYDLLSKRRRIAFAPNGPMHAAFRRQIHGILSVSRTKQNHQIQELESRQALNDILDYSETAAKSENPIFADVQSIFRRYTLSVMMTLSFGHRVQTLHDQIVKTVFDIMDDIARTIQPGQYLVDILPILKRLPYFLRTWEHEVDRKLEWQLPFMQNLLVRTEEQMAKETPNTGLIRALLEQRRGMNDQERDAKFLDDKSIAFQSMTLMEAGSDTTAITVMNFLIAMLLNPRVMWKGQESIDSFMSGSRLPSFQDLPHIPYINQIVKEVMRWRPVILMGIPHSNATDDVLDGYHIPPNSLIFGNIWAMHHDPEHYHDPEDFIPERYDGNNKSAFESSVEADAMDRDHYIFGWGRRICPGMHLAEASVLLLVARLLWAFDIVPATDSNGKQLQVSADIVTAYEHSIIASPKVFPISFKVRSHARGQVIRESYKDALAKWEDMKLDLFRDA